jgi:hypothetical protein
MNRHVNRTLARLTMAFLATLDAASPAAAQARRAIGRA